MFQSFWLRSFEILYLLVPALVFLYFHGKTSCSSRSDFKMLATNKLSEDWKFLFTQELDIDLIQSQNFKKKALSKEFRILNPKSASYISSMLLFSNPETKYWHKKCSYRCLYYQQDLLVIVYSNDNLTKIWYHLYHSLRVRRICKFKKKKNWHRTCELVKQASMMGQTDIK